MGRLPRLWWLRLWRLRLRPRLRLLRINLEQLLQFQLPESFALFQVEVEFRRILVYPPLSDQNTKYQIKTSSKVRLPILRSYYTFDVYTCPIHDTRQVSLMTDTLSPQTLFLL